MHRSGRGHTSPDAGRAQGETVGLQPGPRQWPAPWKTEKSDGARPYAMHLMGLPQAGNANGDGREHEENHDHFEPIHEQHADQPGKVSALLRHGRSWP